MVRGVGIAGARERAARPPVASSRVWAFIVALTAAAVVVTVAAGAIGPPPSTVSHWAVLPLIVPLVAAGLMRVQYYYRGQVEAVDVLEAVLAPALLLFPPWLVVTSVAASKSAAQVVLRIHPVKATFNTAQWAAAAAAGSLVVAVLGAGGSMARRLAVVAVALATVILINHVAVTAVLALATRQRFRQVLAGLRPVISSGWVAAGALNVATGLLLAAAAVGSPWVTPLVLAPLTGLYFTGRHLLTTRLDRDRLGDFKRATEEITGDDATSGAALTAFLTATADCFSAGGADLIIEDDAGAFVRGVGAGSGRPVTDRRIERGHDRLTDELMDGLLGLHEVAWVSARADEPGLAGSLADSGRRGALAAPVRASPARRAVICVYDPQIAGGSWPKEAATLGVLAGELTHAYRSAALDDTMIDEHLRVGRLLAGQAEMLESVAHGGNLAQTIATLAELLEQALPGSRSIIRLEAIGGETSPVPTAITGGNAAAPLPDEVHRAVQDALRQAADSQPVVVDNVGAGGGDDAAGWDGVGSWWALPVLHPDHRELAGVVALASPDIRPPQTPESDMLAGAARLARLALERALSEARLTDQSRHDSLTGLANRRAFLNAAVRAVVRSRRSAEAMVLYVDLDRFKSVNDSLGHRVGDKLLIEVARRIQGVVRPTDVAARLGGDEYAVLCEDLNTIEGLAVADRLSSALGAPVTVDGREVLVTASVGVAFSGRNLTAQTLIERADAAMYRAKERGRNRVEVFDQDLRREALAGLTMRTALHWAVERHEFRLLYQPIVAVATGRTIGAEALVRWDTPGGHLAAPATFIDSAEESGLIVPLGLQILEEACRQAIRWSATAVERFTVSVNLSPRQVADVGVVEDIARVMHDTGVDPTLLIFEITEGTLMEAAESTTTLQSLKALGVGLTVDDFGTGYSSLSYLKRFPVDGLKVDRSFVKGLGVVPEDSAIVAAVIKLAHTLGLAVVAEGVETAAQLHCLQELGCEAAQGFYLGRPGRPDQFELGRTS